MKPMHLQLGQSGEQLAADYLHSIGYTILFSNWRFRRTEIDLIALDKNALVFVEVKSRKSNPFGDPASFVSDRKEYLMQEAAAAYMEQYHYNGEIRFDIIGILFFSETEYQLKHYKDAFF